MGVDGAPLQNCPAYPYKTPPGEHSILMGEVHTLVGKGVVVKTTQTNGENIFLRKKMVHTE